MAVDISKILNKTTDAPDWIGEKIISLVQYRIAQEEFSSRLYRSMSVWLDLNGYTGASKLYKKYSDEEQVHADEFYQYLLDLNVLPIVPALPQPQTTFTGLMDIAQKTLQHELEVTRQINVLAGDAMKANDFMTMQLAQKYLAEQTEEIAKSRWLIDRIEIVGDDKCGLLIIDKELENKV